MATRKKKGPLTAMLANYNPPPTPTRRQQAPTQDDGLRVFERLVGETLIAGSHPEGFLKGVEARINEVGQAKRTTEAEQILAELVAATTREEKGRGFAFPWNTRRQIDAFESAKSYLRKHGINWED